jgi:hypothetical protein
MGPSPDSTLLLLLVPAALALFVGAVLLRRGLRGRRIGETPHCRNCDYPLVGIDSGRCPECGADLRSPLAVASGQRVRSRAVASCGAALVVLGLIAGYTALGPVVRRFDYYGVMPTGWLIDRMNDASTAVASRAWDELERRTKSGDLSAANRARLAEIALGRQAKGISFGVVDWLGRAVADGKISEPQTKRFLGQIVVVTLHVREKVAPGDPIPYEVKTLSHSPFASQGWWHRVEYLPVFLDGKQVSPGGGSSGGAGPNAGGSSGSWIPCDAPGPHTVTTGVRVKVFHGGPAFDENGPGSQLKYVREIPLSGNTEVLAEMPPGFVKLVKDPALADLIRSGIRVIELARGPGGKGAEARIEARCGSATAMAFEVFVRTNGTEQPLGTISLIRGNSSTFLLRGDQADLGDATHADVILRSSEKVARRTVHVVDIWDGELVFPRVPVKKNLSQ